MCLEPTTLPSGPDADERMETDAEIDSQLRAWGADGMSRRSDNGDRNIQTAIILLAVAMLALGALMVAESARNRDHARAQTQAEGEGKAVCVMLPKRSPR